MPNTFELKIAQPDPHAYMVANEATGSRFPNISNELSKFSTLYRFLDKHRNVSPATLARNVTENGKPIFSQMDMPVIMNLVNLRHNTIPNIHHSVQHGGDKSTPPPITLRDPTKPGYNPKDDMFGATQRPGYQEPPHQVEFWEKVFHSLYKSYEKSPFYLHFSEKWDGIWWYFYLMYNLEHMDLFGPYISMALDTLTTNIPAIGEGIEVIMHYGAGFVGGILTAGLAAGPAAETGTIIADIITAYMAFVGAIISISRKRTGDAFKLILVAIPFDIGATLNMFANGIEKQYSRYLVNRERIINTFKPLPTLQTWLDYYVPEVGEDKGPPPPPITAEAIKEDLANTVMEKTGANKALAKLNAIKVDPLGAAAKASGANKAIANTHNKIKAATTLPPMPELPTVPAMPSLPSNTTRAAFAPTPIRKRGGGGKTRKYRRRIYKRHRRRHTRR